MVQQTLVENHPLTPHSLSAAAVVGICFGVLVMLGTASAIAYKCYKRQLAKNAQNRLSSAIKKGLKESNNGNLKKVSSARKVIMKSKATSPTYPSSGEHIGGSLSERGLVSGSGAGPLPSQFDPCQVKAEYYIENEKDGATPEKDESMREKHEDELKTPHLGTLHFSTEYDSQKSALLVTILQAAELPPREPSVGGCDPYIKLQLLPEKKHKCKTRVLRKTLNPVYDETFTFYGISFNQLQSITLHFVVLSFDRFSRDEIIGEVIYPLNGVDLSQKEVSVSKDITPRHLKFRTQGRGELLVSLCYQPAANRLTVVVLKARNLPKMDVTGLSDPYVKIYLLYNGQRIAKKKTHVKKRTLNPVFNESFLFDVPYNEGLQNISLEFLLLDYDRMTKNEVIGRLEVGARTLGQELHHWNEVMNCPRKQIAEWHKLKE